MEKVTVLEGKNRHFAMILDDFETMSKLVLEQYRRVQHILDPLEPQPTLAEIEEAERIIDGMEVKLHNDVVQALVLYTPRATESRLVMSYYDITSNLERVGDLLLNACQHLMKSYAAGSVYAELLQPCQILFGEVLSGLETSLFAFRCGDAPAGRGVIAADDRVDALYDEIEVQVPQLVVKYGTDAREAETALHFYMLAYILERIGDHATNIAEAIIYTFQGNYVKHVHDESPSNGDIGANERRE